MGSGTEGIVVIYFKIYVLPSFTEKKQSKN